VRPSGHVPVSPGPPLVEWPAMLICVMGPAAAGKSSLAKAVASLAPDGAARVPVDWFFVPRAPEQPLDDFWSQPLRYDWPLLDAAMAAEDPARRSTPSCDFAEFRRTAETGGLPIAHAPVYVLDGMRPHPRCDAVVLLTLDGATQRARLTQRDREWGTDLAQRTAHLRITHEQGLADLAGPPDLVLDAAAPLADNARTVRDHVSGRTGQDGSALAATTSAYQRAESLGVRTSVS
jgi:hypothetical protein